VKLPDYHFAVVTIYDIGPIIGVILLTEFCFVESASATVICSIFLDAFFRVSFPELVKGVVQLCLEIISGFVNGASGIGVGLQEAANGFATGITGLWTGLYDVGKEIKGASVAICEVSSLKNVAIVATWAILLMCAPSVAKGLNDLLSKSLPKMFMKLGGDVNETAGANQ
jgi:hypothetical protein